MKFHKKIIKDLAINKVQIQNNLDQGAILVSTEALMFLLGNKIGKQCAHELIYNASLLCDNTGKELIDVLLKNPAVNNNFTKDDLKQAVLPENHIGLSGDIIDRLIQKTKDLTL